MCNKTASSLFAGIFFLFFAQISVSQPYTISETTRLSFGTYTGAAEANAAVVNPKVSRNGRFIVFESTATNLVDTSSGNYAGFTNIDGAKRQIYLVDRQAGTLELVSITAAYDNAAPMDSHNPVVSADGRYVAYVATTTGAQAELMNTAIDGNLGNGNSCLDEPTCHVNRWQDGTHVWIRDRLANANFLASQVTMPAKVQAMENGVPKTSVEKRCPAPNCFSKTCDASTQVDTTVPVMTTKNVRLAQGILTSLSPLTISAATAANPYLSGDGEFIVFDSNSNYLAGVVDVTIPDPVCGTDYNIGTDNNGVLDGDYIGMPSSYYLDANGTTRDVFVRDGATFTNTIASYYCKFHATSHCFGQGALDATKGTISDDGKRVSWQTASNMLDLDFNTVSDVYLSSRSLLNGEFENLDRLSNATNRITASNGTSTDAAISADGRYVAFQSSGSNIVSSDTNAVNDIFIYGTNFFSTVRCLNSSGVQGDGSSTLPTLTGGGESVGFYSSATNFGASSGFSNAFVGSLSKNTSGRLIGCSVALASPGAAGTGANANVVNVGVGIVPRTVTQGSTQVRKRVTTVVYQTTATNVHTGSTDGNAVADIFQAPTCTTADATTDTDGDGTVDCFDQCLNDALKVEDVDADSDGVPDCEDGCKSDSQKIAPGFCGCGVVDVDSDGDAKPDCVDSCPNDANKIVAGACGCGQPDVDLNNNGVIDCVESTNPTPTPGGPTPTPGTNATPSPTATPVFTTITPRKPELERAGNKKLLGTLLYEGIPPSNILYYEVQLQKRVGGVKKVTTKRVAATASNVVTFKNLQAATYRIRFRAVHTNTEVTKWSPFSVAVSVR